MTVRMHAIEGKPIREKAVIATAHTIGPGISVAIRKDHVIIEDLPSDVDLSKVRERFAGILGRIEIIS